MARKVIAVILVLGFAAPAPSVWAQDRPVVFVHGMKGENSWDVAAERLRHRLAITPFVPTLPWREVLETQAASLQAQYAGLPASTIAVGHSNGGIASRLWTTMHPMSAVVTLGSPQQGAPFVDRLLDILYFNLTLYNYLGLAGSALGWQPNEWAAVFVFVQGALLFGQSFAIGTVWRMTAILGIELGLPVLPQISTGSYLIASLNSAGNLGREALDINTRVGLAYIANNYWRAGPARALDPENADLHYVAMVVSIVTLEYAASYLWANYPGNWTAQSIANGLYAAASIFRQVDPFWCWAVTNDASCNTPHDGIVPYWSQQYPGALNFGIVGPAHTQENKVSDDLLVAVLTAYAGVAYRSGAAPPPPGGSTGADTLSPGENLVPGDSIRSADGRYELAYQGDGNLVLYRISDGAALWNTGTFSAGQVEMQNDGNLVIYNSVGTPLWASNTSGFAGARLVVQTDGNLVIYDYYGYPRWSSGTAH